jgi:hypothetical protein
MHEDSAFDRHRINTAQSRVGFEASTTLDAIKGDG